MGEKWEFHLGCQGNHSFPFCDQKNKFVFAEHNTFIIVCSTELKYFIDYLFGDTLMLPFFNAQVHLSSSRPASLWARPCRRANSYFLLPSGIELKAVLRVLNYNP